MTLDRELLWKFLPKKIVKGEDCYVISWLYFLAQVVRKDVGHHVPASVKTSFLLCTDCYFGKFPILPDCLAGDFIE